MMPNHKPHTYSHEDVCFVLEYLKNENKILQKKRKAWPTPQIRNSLHDNKRCIQILEKEDEC